MADVTRSAGGSSAPELSRAVASGELVRAILPCEIRIVDEEKREIELCATSEAVDTYGTIFGYEASKDAFTRWIGNVREMHVLKAVGTRVALRFDDAARKIYARLRISKGAQDTWEKVKDGTLRGASIGAAGVTWEQKRAANGQDVPYATRYDLMELSLVDYPSNPDALGVTFVRDGVPADETLLDELSDGGDGTHMAGVGIADGASVQPSAGGEPEAPTSQPDFPADQAQEQERERSEPTIREAAGALDTVDPAAVIAAAALMRGQSELAVPAGIGSSTITEPTVKQRRLAALGAPDYAHLATAAVTSGAQVASRASLTVAASGEGALGYGVGQPFDMDGDHESAEDYVPMQSGPRADDLVHAPDAHGHATHAHAHTGDYGEADAHRHPGVHMHVDGTSHEHDHLHDHGHHDHASETQPSTAQIVGSQDRGQDRVMAGHAHPHAHSHDHGHYYRVADGAPTDSRLVTGEQARTHEYVSSAAFRAAAGIEGQPMTAEQYRAAVAHELRIIQARALGPYSRNPRGPADAGTPDEAPVSPSSTDVQQSPEGNAGSPSLDQVNLEDELRRTGQCPLCHGQVRALDRDGNPIAAADANGAIPGDSSSEGTSNIGVPADGWDGRTVVAEITRDLTRAMQPQYAALAGSLADLAERLARIEAQPQSAGPVLRTADRGSAFAPGGFTAASKPGVNEQYAALESLAGKLADPQAQVAVAAEMIRLQQEQAGMPAAMQVMPRAGHGWGS